MSTDQMWGLADAWYHDRDDPQWRRRTREESQKVFDNLGLTGDFWKLG